MSVVCCFSGHRSLRIGSHEEIYRLLERAVSYYAEQGCVEFRTGGAVGFDALAALAVINLRSKYPQIKLHLYLPCRDHDRYWSQNDKKMCDFILESADHVKYINERYSAGVMHARNRALVNGSDVCIAFCERTSGGTAYTVSYAEKNNVRVVNLRSRIK